LHFLRAARCNLLCSDGITLLTVTAIVLQARALGIKLATSAIASAFDATFHIATVQMKVRGSLAPLLSHGGFASVTV